LEKTGNKKKDHSYVLDKKKKIIVGIAFLLVIIMLGFSYYMFFYQEPPPKERGENEVVDDTISPPEVQQAVSLEIHRIHKKGIEKLMRKVGNSWKKNPNYHFVAVIDDEEWIGTDINSWDTGYVGWENVKLVKDEQVECNIELEIFETKKKLFRSYDQEVVNFRITYDFRTGRWHGDDNFNDSDGYGHYSNENYEIWFYVHQAEEDGDGIPYWSEVNKLHTDPRVDDSKLDPDMDGIPTAWEWKWGYNPFVYDNHSVIDSEKDGLSNLEEYAMRKWLADPFYKDIYIEVDFMEKGPGLFARKHVFWKESQFMLMDKFHEHDITVHIDDGWPGSLTNGGGEYLSYIEDYIGPFSGIGTEYYKYHFADERKGVFRYVFICHSGGWAWPQDHKMWVDVISIPSSFKYFAKNMFPPALTPRLQRISMAVTVMHELGHTLGLISSYNRGIDNATMVGRNDLPPLQKVKAYFEAIKYWSDYESCMNYNKFISYLLDYSDGSHGPHDFDDWGFIDITFFNKPMYIQQ
jgi:hypothetical protein